MARDGRTQIGLAALVALVLTACSGGSPGASTVVPTARPVTSGAPAASSASTGQPPSAATVSDPCDLLTLDEIGQVLGEEPSDPEKHTDACWWYYGDAAAGESNTLEASLYGGADASANFAAWQRQFSQSPQSTVQLDVAGHPAVYQSGTQSNPALVVQTADGGALVIQASGPAATPELQQQFIALAQFALPRTG